MAILTSGTTFVANTQISATDLNNAVNNAAFTSGSVDNSTTQLSSGAIIVKDAGITPAKIATTSSSWSFVGSVSTTGNTVVSSSTAGNFASYLGYNAPCLAFGNNSVAASATQRARIAFSTNANDFIGGTKAGDSVYFTEYVPSSGYSSTNSGNHIFAVGTGNSSSLTSVATISSSGLSVAGAITATGSITSTSSSDAAINLTITGAGIGFKSASDSGNQPYIVTGGDNTLVFRCPTGGFKWDNQASSASVMTLTNSGDLVVSGSLSKGSGSFRIDHPLPQKTETHQLVHSFIEGPKADLIYRGVVLLVNGTATVNIDEVSSMTEGTFVALCRNVQSFTSNESDWSSVRGSVSGNILTIECEDANSNAEVSWMVIGERCDKHMLEANWTDSNGRVIVEPAK
jgi:hypothetical protein